MPTRVDRHLRSVRLAKDCAELGARIRTIHTITGLPPREIQRLLFNDPQAIPRGRPPDSPEWYHSANLLYRTDASIFATTYRRLRRADIGAGDALVGAYRHYRMVCQAPHRISFDRAFDLVSHSDGIWITRSPSFAVVTCPSCASEFLAAIGTVPTADACPFCKLVKRYGNDRRVQTSFPTHPLPDPSAFQLGMMALYYKNESAADGDSPAP
jgi:hypothetical protein